MAAARNPAGVFGRTRVGASMIGRWSLVLLALMAVLPAALGGAAMAGCGDNGDPGYRKPDGTCVSWCELESACGAGGRCTAEKPDRIVLTLQAVRKGDPSLPRCKGCGCKGGPGYRMANGQCVGWDQLDRRCGSPPETRCTPELVDPSSATVAWAQAEYARLRADCR